MVTVNCVGSKKRYQMWILKISDEQIYITTFCISSDSASRLFLSVSAWSRLDVTQACSKSLLNKLIMYILDSDLVWWI